MRKKALAIWIGTALLLAFTASSCNKGYPTTADPIKRETVLSNDNTSEERNRLLTEDIQYFKEELPKRHKNLFSKISKEEFDDQTEQLLKQVDQLGNKQVFVELNKIVAAVGDAHTSINYWDGYSFPLQFWCSEDNIYVVNADIGLKEMMYSRVLKVDGVPIDEVLDQLTTLISYENESWLLAMLPNYLRLPVYLNGLGIIPKETEAVFTVEKSGEIQDFRVSALKYGETGDYVKDKAEDILLGSFEKYYAYEYLPDHKSLYFRYNVCADMEDESFADFNNDMMNQLEQLAVDKIIVDLRSNTGGNSEILNPFTKRLRDYYMKNSDVKIYILVGRHTISSGMFAIYRIKEAVPEAISVGEPTGGALDCYGDVREMKLPNSQLPVGYSTKYFEFTKMFTYKNDGIGTFLPDVILQPTIEDYEKGEDVVLTFVLKE